MLYQLHFNISSKEKKPWIYLSKPIADQINTEEAALNGTNQFRVNPELTDNTCNACIWEHSSGETLTPAGMSCYNRVCHIDNSKCDKVCMGLDPGFDFNRI